MNYFPHHIGDYAKDTAHLSMTEDGAYRRLMDLCYATERPLPADKKAIYRLSRAMSKVEQRAVDTVLVEFFKLEQDGWHQKRIDIEIAKAQEKSRKAKDSAGKRWQSDGNANAYAEAMPESEPPEVKGNAPNNQEPITKNQKPKVKPSASRLASMPEGVDLAVWQDFIAHRKAKNAPLTETALAGIAREADRAGVSLEVAMRTCCERGWQGFNAEWVGKTAAPDYSSLMKEP